MKFCVGGKFGICLQDWPSIKNEKNTGKISVFSFEDVDEFDLHKWR